MKGADNGIYADIARRTGGDIYIGVVGPVRTGKSTLIKRMMEILVIPNITNIYQKERAMDELPQSGSGKTIMTSEPKFVPEEAVTVSPDGKTNLSVRLIDSVGYMIPGAVGATEDGQPRMVTTPWYPEEIPMTDAAELGTKKVMKDHCSIGIVVTTDGTITDIDRNDYIDAEKKAIVDMQKTGKPFIILVNSSQPESMEAVQLRDRLEAEYGVTCCLYNCLQMKKDDLEGVLSCMLREFPASEVQFRLPRWMDALSPEHPVKSEIYESILKCVAEIKKLSEAESKISGLTQSKNIENARVSEIACGSGIVSCEVYCPEAMFYGILSDQSGFIVESDADLLKLLKELSKIKKAYDKVSAALEQVRATGYGIVMPTPDEMHLEIPQIVRKGSNYGVRLKASAPSIHMMRADIETEISPIVGDEKQSEDLLQYLLKEYEGDTEKLWDSNIFGKSVYELVNEGLGTKLKKMPEHSRMKLQNTLSRIINEGSSGLLCIILA